MEKYADVQQLMKKEYGQNRKPIYPPTVIQAVFDAKTGASLEAILAQFNSVYVQYQGTPKDTRLIIPMEMRRAGLTITYMDMDSNTITERANSAVQKDNDHWALDVNWSRVDELSLSGDISVSAKGTWIINGVDTGIKAVGPKGDAGLTPWLKTIDNKLHFSYDNVTWEPCSDYIAGYFRVEGNKLQISRDKSTWENVSDFIAAWFRWNDNKIQISRDNNTWTDFSGKFADNVHIKGYVANYASLPSGAVQGEIYGVGPTYAAEDTAHTNPIYRYYVRNANTWVDNGSFTSLSAGVVQETGDSETKVMSQKAVSTKLSELGQKVGDENLTTNISTYRIYNSTYINNSSHQHVHLSGYAVAVFKVKVGKEYTLNIPKSGNGVMVSCVFVAGNNQATNIPSSTLVGNEGNQTFKIIATTEWMQCTYDVNGGVPTLEAIYTLTERAVDLGEKVKSNETNAQNNKENIDNILGRMNVGVQTNISSISVKDDYYVNQTNGTLYYLNGYGWSTAIYKVIIGQTYKIQIPKSGNAVCASVAWGDKETQTSGITLEGYCLGNEAEQEFTVVAKGEYLYSTFVKNEGFPLLELVESKPIEEVVENNAEKIKDLEERIPSSNVRISLAKEYNLTVGEKFELFFRGIFSGLNYLNYEFSVDFGSVAYKGNHFNEKWEWTPLESHIGSYPITIKAYSDSGLISSATTTLKVNASELTSDDKVCLLIGDSLMYDNNKGSIAGEVYRRICSTDVESEADGVVYPKGYGKSNFKFIGQIQSSKQPKAYSVGVGGWTAKYYNEKSDRYDYQYIVCSHDKKEADQHSVYKDSEGVQWKLESIEDGRIKVYVVSGQYPMRMLSGTLTWVSGGENHSNIVITSSSIAPGNPFWFNGKVDFAAYAESKGVSVIDYVVIELGTNNKNTDDETILNDTRTLIDNILASYPNCKISLMTTHTSAREGWYSDKETYYDWLQFCATLKELYNSLIKEYPSNLKVIDMAAMIDIERCGGWSYMEYNARYRGNVPQYRKTFLNNALHPNYAGYMMIADMIVRDIVARF